MFADLLALSVFTLSTSVTPGPNNVMLMTSGVNFGLRRTLPHAVGVALGFTLMVAIGAFGFAGVFAAAPGLKTAITLVGVVYLVWLALRIATAPVVVSPAGRPRNGAVPLTFFQAVLFQWVNPKGWVMMIGVVSVYVPLNGVAAVLVAFLLAGLLSALSWAWFGTVLARILAAPRQLRLFNVTMAVLLVLSLAPAIAELAAALSGSAP
jgi:threonine/homoserine/homoserine lactone efflux protein